MSEPMSRRWAPIEDLPGELEPLIRPDVHAAMREWARVADDLKQTDAFTKFLMRLRREWAIETGVIERLYSISEGATKTLIEQGLDAALLSHGDTDIPAARVIEFVSDQYNAIEGLYQFISGDRPLGTSYIRELHRVLTAHQETYIARDSLGSTVERPMRRGEWKRFPNNVEGPNGFTFEFCPPEHVDAEMEKLVRHHAEHYVRAVPADIEAAWLHHRFTLIHPFEDGNGRVARCLATLVLLKANWFPLVITRSGRGAYLQALRAADGGALAPLVELFGALQIKAVSQAVSVAEDVKDARADRGTVLEGIRRDAAKRESAGRKAAAAAEAIAAMLLRVLVAALNNAAQSVRDADPGQVLLKSAVVRQAERGDERDHYHRYQIVECARQLGYVANLEEHRAWALLRLDSAASTSELLFSFHGVGTAPRGILACAAMVYVKEPKTSGAARRVASPIEPLCDSPFFVTVDEGHEQLSARFESWADRMITLGLDTWRRTMGA